MVLQNDEFQSTLENHKYCKEIIKSGLSKNIHLSNAPPCREFSSAFLMLHGPPQTPARNKRPSCSGSCPLSSPLRSAPQAAQTLGSIHHAPLALCSVPAGVFASLLLSTWPNICTASSSQPASASWCVSHLCLFHWISDKTQVIN